MFQNKHSRASVSTMPNTWEQTRVLPPESGQLAEDTGQGAFQRAREH